MRHHSHSLATTLFCCSVGILIAGAPSCMLDESGLQNSEGGANFESSSGTSVSSSSSGAPTLCGDLSVDMNEMCDDGNNTPGDRCSATCTIETPDLCPGTAIALKKGEKITITDTTMGAEDDFVGARADVGNCDDGDFPGADLVYAVTVASDGVLTAQLDADFSRSFVRARPDCMADKETELACEYRWDPGTTGISFMVTANSTYYVAADSWDMRAGPFRLTLSLD